VVRYFKKLSAICTVSQGRVQAGIASNRTAPGVERPEQPKSMYLEDLVLSEEEKLLQAHGLLEAVPHFEALLKRTLQVLPAAAIWEGYSLSPPKGVQHSSWLSQVWAGEATCGAASTQRRSVGRPRIIMPR